MVYKDMIKVNEPKSGMSEVYRVLRNNIEFAYNNSNVKSVLVTSSKNGEGKTTVATNLAVTMANSGKKTLLIDCNLNSPSLHKVFKMSNNIGLTTVLKNEKYMGEAATKTNYENLYLLTSGINSERFSELLMSKKISDLLKTLKEKYEFIIVDTPAVMERSDAQIISQYVDGCLLVIGSGEVNKEEARKTKELLEKVNAKILGAVLNKIEDTKKVAVNIGEDENVIVTEVKKVKSFQGNFRLGNLKGGGELRKKGVFARFFMMFMVMMMLSMQLVNITAKAADFSEASEISEITELKDTDTNTNTNDIIINASVKQNEEEDEVENKVQNELKGEIENKKPNEKPNEKQIVVTVRDNLGLAKENVQIWGSTGSTWILVKDFGSDEGTIKGKVYTYVWDLKEFDNEKNESYYSDRNYYNAYYSGGESYNNPFSTKNEGEYKIYVKYRECNNYKELYKTLYLNSDKINFVTIQTNMDSTQANTINKYEFPVVAVQNTKFDISITTEDKNAFQGNVIKDFTAKIVCNNHSINLSKDNSKKQWTWKPSESGIFNIVVMDSSERIVAIRKVYVNPKNKGYLQVNELKLNESEDGFKADIANPNNVNTDVEFVIGEPNVWSKTVKNHSIDTNTYEIKENDQRSENSDQFTFNKGNYFVGVFVKGEHSIEFEDAIVTNYKKTEPNASKDFSFTLGEVIDTSGEYTFTIPLDTDEEGNNLEYAFLLWDARGKKVIKEYSDAEGANVLTWKPAISGKYVVYGRVRQKDNEENKYLPNSYEAEAANEVIITDPEVGTIKIDNTRVYNKNKTKAIVSHEMNYIEIKATYKNDQCGTKDRLMYKAYAIHDGHWMTLSDYSPNNIIPFYPKSSGQYKIITLVKDSLSGSEEVRREFTITVND